MRALRYSAVLFDAGETLIAPRESFGAVYARVLAELGVPLAAEDLESGLRRCWADINAALIPGVDRYAAASGGEHAYWLRFVEGTLERTPGVTEPRTLAARALDPLRAAFRRTDAWKVYDDVLPVLTALREDGARLAVVSNWDSSLPPLLERLGLAEWFHAIVVSHVEGVEKPNPELFLRALRRISGTPDRTLHVGDVPELDGAGAAAAGIASVLVDRRGRWSAPDILRDLRRVPAIVRGESAAPGISSS